MADQSLYDVDAVRILFDEMASTYGRVNLISSFGFAARWRHRAVTALPVARPRARVADLMSGMGELWRSIALHESSVEEVVAIDISAQMMVRAPRQQPFVITLREEDVLHTSLPPESFDAVLSSFGLKTFNADQQLALSRVVAHLLRPGGAFSFVEISVPRSTVLRVLYMLYINRIIPLLGRLFLGNPANYRLLGAYTEAFGDCRHFAECLRTAGLRAEFRTYFFGCASGVTGRKPEVSA